MAEEQLNDNEIALGEADFESPEAYQAYCLMHSTAHLMAAAVKELHPEAQFAIGPPTKDGTNRFYYDMLLDEPISVDEFEAIEARMREIAKRNQPFVQETWESERAKQFFTEQNQPFKLELIEGIAEPTVSIYKVGDFVDLCAGPHVRYSSKLKHFKLLSVAGAYWRGDSSRQMLQRVYGTVWSSKGELQTYLERLEEAKKRDHRRLGKQLDLFMTHEWAAGSIFWLPKGAVVYRTLQQKMLELLLDNGYQEVSTPQLFNQKLWETSGHWKHFKENMFSFQEAGGDAIHSLKPMNCPSHMLIFGSRRRSYRELPLRLHDQGVLHRNEPTGSLGGLTRVRMFRQDDAHIFITRDQIAEEVQRVMGLIDRVYSAFGMSYRVVFSTRPDKAMGDKAMWDKAEAELLAFLERSGVPFKVEEGEGAFYGPKIDFKVKDSLGREHQCATIQLDVQLPVNFGLSYVSEHNVEETPVVVHRAIYGSFERFLAVLIEHYGGAFPAWLHPVQCTVMTISEHYVDYAREVHAKLVEAGIRAELDVSDEKIGAKVRLAELDKVPYMVTVGQKEEETRSVNVRERGKGRKSLELSLDDFVGWLVDETSFSF